MNNEKVFHGLDTDIEYAMSAPTDELSMSFLDMRCKEHKDPAYQKALIHELSNRLRNLASSHKKAKRSLKRALTELEGGTL